MSALFAAQRGPDDDDDDHHADADHDDHGDDNLDYILDNVDFVQGE